MTCNSRAIENVSFMQVCYVVRTDIMQKHLILAGS